MDSNDRFLRLPQVMDKVGFKKDWIYKEMKAGRFPQYIKIGPKHSVWLESEIITWMEARIVESPEVERKNTLPEKRHKNQYLIPFCRRQQYGQLSGISGQLKSLWLPRQTDKPFS